MSNTQETEHKVNIIDSGSIRQLLKILYPVCISTISGFLMIFVDRVFLSRYSIDAMKAASSAGTLYWMIAGMFFYVATVAGTFVAKINGEKRYSELARPVWQTIYFGLFSILPFCVLSPFTIDIITDYELLSEGQALFLKYNYFYTPILVINTAISSFFIGQGKTTLVTASCVVGNIINVFVNYFLVFGYDDYIQPLGIKGSAISTAISILIQIIILSFAFFNNSNRINCNTTNYAFDKKLFIDILIKGLSAAVALFFELLGWSCFYLIISKTGSDNSVFAAVTQAIFLLFLFFGEAIDKASGTIAGNLIGSGKFGEVKRLLRSGLIVVIIFGFFVLLFLTVAQDFIVDIFLDDKISTHTDKVYEGVLQLSSKIKSSLPMLALYITLEAMRFHATGILISLRHSFFIMKLTPILIWSLMVLPTYFFIYREALDISLSLYFFSTYAVVAFLLMLRKINSSLK